MSTSRVISILGLAVTISMAVYSAFYVGAQIDYLHHKLSPSTRNLNVSAEWHLTELALPKLEDQLSNSLQKNDPIIQTRPSGKEAVISPSQ